MMLLSGFAIPVYGYIAWAIRYRANTAYRSFTISVQWVSMAFVLLHAVRFGCASICPPIVDYNSTEGTAAATLITLSQVLTFVLAFAVEHMVVNKIAYEAFKETKTLAMQLEKKEALASTDSLTGLFNRRKIEALIREQHQILVNMGACYSILLIDVDHFKRVNDHYGHAVGDEVLMHLSHCIRDHIRGVDNVGRWGGEEFLVLLPNAALEEARKTAERLRGTVAAHVYSEMPELNLTISVGVIEANRMMTIDETLRSVDKMLYGAKANGRNSVFSGSVEVVASTSGGQ
jgi:diguanylate cyclase (GGDEF)-like protein